MMDQLFIQPDKPTTVVRYYTYCSICLILYLISYNNLRWSNEDNILYFSEFSNFCVDNIYQNNLTIGKRYVCTCIVIAYHAKVITNIVSFTLTARDNSHDYQLTMTGRRDTLLNCFLAQARILNFISPKYYSI